jgi:hypothetical protein
MKRRTTRVAASFDVTIAHGEASDLKKSGVTTAMKHSLKTGFLALLCSQWLAIIPVTAAEDQPGPTVLTARQLEAKPFEYPWDVQVFDLPTSGNGINYRLYVRAPLRQAESGQNPSVFYFLDPLALFTPAAAMSYNYEFFNYIPAAWFVGIGYQDEADGQWKEANRTRDYTPTEFEPPNENHYLAANPVDYLNSGGADAFLDVLVQEIIPFIENSYEVDSDDRVLIGKSMSGLVASHALLTRPDLFQRYLIVSPAIWWDDFLYPREQRAIMRTEAETSATVYPSETRAWFAVGEAEESLSLVTDLHVMVNALRNSQRQNLAVHLEVLPGEMHEGVFPGAFMRGILSLYANDARTRESSINVDW